MINLTEAAVKKIKELSDSDDIGHYSIRVRIIGGGCSGMTNDIYYDDQITDLDEIIEQDGVKILVDTLSMQYLEDTTIDYLEGAIMSGFKFTVPKSTGSCGCGSSISF